MMQMALMESSQWALNDRNKAVAPPSDRPAKYDH